VFYDAVNKTLAVYNDESDVTLQLGQEIYIRAKNVTGDTLLNGTLIYISGASSGNPTIDKARSDSPNTTGVIAMTTHDIDNEQMGFCTTLGSVGGLNTDGLAVGTVLYLSETVEGTWQDFAPTAPNFPIQIGVVIQESLTEGKILINVGPTDVAQTMVIQDLEINEDLRVDKKFTLNPSAVTSITAAGGITITNATMRIKGDGSPVIITASPQIAPSGTDGQIILLHGSDDVNTVTIHDGDGLHLHSGTTLIMGDRDMIVFQYDTSAGLWAELTTNFDSFNVSWSFRSPAGLSGDYYICGFYVLGSTSYTPAGGTSLGTANAAYGAHAFIVLGATSTDMIVRVTGTSINEQGVRVPGDTADIDTSGGVLNDYFETSKKWVGTISLSLQSGTGVAVNDGLCKYWDNHNTDFRVTDLEVTGLCGASDSNPNFEVIKHTETGWTFNVGSEPTPPTPVASLQDDYAPEHQFINNEPFAWKRSGLTEEFSGAASEGIICRVVTTVPKSIESLDWQFTIRPS
jgi:hypothetical protein